MKDYKNSHLRIVPLLHPRVEVNTSTHYNAQVIDDLKAVVSGSEGILERRITLVEALINIGLVNEAFSLLEEIGGKGDQAICHRLASIAGQNGLIYTKEKYLSSGSANLAPQSVTVYVPCYNGAMFLEETLSAIVAQSYPVHELIVVDDGSTDNSCEIARRFTTKVVQHETNRGLATARNSALQAATGEYIAAIDADTVPDRFWLERLILGMNEPQIASIGGRLIERQVTTVADRWRKKMMAQHHGDTAKKNVHIFGCNSLSRTDVLKKLGGFNEACKTSYDDIDMSERILGSGYETAYIPEAVCFHCRRDTSQSIITSAYRWRLPPFEIKGVFQDPKSLAAKWFTEIRLGIQEIFQLGSENQSELLYPSFLGLFGPVLFDLITVYKGDSSSDREMMLKAGYALLSRSIQHIAHLSDLVKSETLKRMKSFVLRDVTFVSEDALLMIDAAALKAPSAQRLIEDLNFGAAYLLQYLTVCFSELSSVLNFGPEIAHALHASLELVIVDDAFKNTLHDQTPSISISKINFDRSPWGLRETITELSGLKPQRVQIFSSETDLHLAHYVSIILTALFDRIEVKIITQG